MLSGVMPFAAVSSYTRRRTRYRRIFAKPDVDHFLAPIGPDDKAGVLVSVIVPGAVYFALPK